MTTQEHLDKLRMLRDDLTVHAKTCLKIKTKAGETKSFALNPVQEYVHQRIERQRAETGRVRALILKGRQQGISTYISARYYHRASMRRGVSVFILTHEDKATQNLFDMAKRYNDNNPIAPSTSNDNAKELTFGGLDSGYGVGTAGAKAVGRSKTIQLLHGSEAAFWPNAASHFAGVVQAVPDLPGTEILLESTANGVGGEFHERWQMAERGEGDYIAIFVPWYWTEEYARDIPEGFTLNEEEKEYLASYDHKGLTLRHMVWRRAKIAELKDPLLFKQEYPATAAEAFQTTGHDSYIKAEPILRARKADLEGFGPLVLGADPSRFGDDKFAIAWRKGRKVLKVDAKGKLSVVDGANWIREIIDQDSPDAVFVDVGGLGAGTFDILISWGSPYDKIVKAVNFGSKPHQPARTDHLGNQIPGPLNRRSEMWMNSRDWLESEGGADIPDMDVLQADACGPAYKYTIDQNLQLESKQEMRSRKVKSPDYWDAVALTFAEPVKVKLENTENQRYRNSSRRSGWVS